MKKKWGTGIACFALVCAMAAAGGQTLAAEWHPSRTQSELDIAESTITAPDGSAIAVIQAPAAGTEGTVRQVADLADYLIQVTPVSVTLAANASVDAANLNSTGEQLASLPTSSGLSYGVNRQLNDLYRQVTSAESTRQLLAAAAPAAAAEFQGTVGESADAYTPIALYDVAASPSAAAAIARNSSVQVAVLVPGVADGARLAAVCWDRDGNSCLVPVRVADGVVYLTVRSSGPVMIMTRVQTQG